METARRMCDMKKDKKNMLMENTVTKHGYRVFSIPTSYLESLEFKSQTTDGQFCLTPFMFFFDPSKKCWDSTSDWPSVFPAVLSNSLFTNSLSFDYYTV